MKGCFYFNDIIQIYHLPGKHAPDGKHAPEHASFFNFGIFISLVEKLVENWWKNWLKNLVEKLISDQNSILTVGNGILLF